MGATVSGFSKEPKGDPNLWTSLGLSDVHHYIGDVSNIMSVEDVLARERPEIVFHLAGEASVGRAFLNPAETFLTNIMGSVSLLDAISRTPAVRACVVGSSKWRQQGPIGSSIPGRSSSLFSTSIDAAETVVGAMRDCYFSDIEGGSDCRVAIARAGNVIGGGDWAENRVVPDIVRGCFGPEQSVLIKEPNAVKPWQHVLEPLRGYLMLAEGLASGSGAWAQDLDFFGKPDKTKSVLALADAMVAKLGCGYVEIASSEVEPTAADVFEPDLDKSAKFGWISQLTFDQAVDLTGAWYSSLHKGEAPIELCRGQIDTYLELCNGR